MGLQMAPLYHNRVPDTASATLNASVAICEGFVKPQGSLQTILEDAFNGKEYAHSGLCDFQAHNVPGWHRDFLHLNWAKLQKHHPWRIDSETGEEYTQYRLITYFDDHTNDND